MRLSTITYCALGTGCHSIEPICDLEQRYRPRQLVRAVSERVGPALVMIRTPTKPDASGESTNCRSAARASLARRFLIEQRVLIAANKFGYFLQPVEESATGSCLPWSPWLTSRTDSGSG